MRRTLQLLTVTFALLTPTAGAQHTYLALEPHTTLAAAEAQAATITGRPTVILTETTSIPGFENINLQQHTYRVLIGPIPPTDLSRAQTELTQQALTHQVIDSPEQLRTAYQVHIGSYRSNRLATDAQTALEALGEPTFSLDAAPFTFVHAGPYSTRAAAQAALERIHASGITATPALGTLTSEHQAALNQQETTPNEVVANTQPEDEPATPEPPKRVFTITRIDRPEPETTTTPDADQTEPQAAATNDTTTANHEASGEEPITGPTAAEPRPMDGAPDTDAALTDVQGEASVELEQRVVVEEAYVHVATGRDHPDLQAALTILDELTLTPQVRLTATGAYHLYVGPLPVSEAHELRRALTHHGLTPYSTPNPTGQSAALPEPTPNASEELATHAEGEAIAAEERTTTEPEVASDNPTDDPAAPHPNALEAASQDPSWEPQQPVLTGREELQPGVYLSARMGDLASHQATSAELLDDGHELAYLQTGEQVLLLVGPIPEWLEDDTRTELRRRGMPAHSIYAPNYTPQAVRVAQAAESATSPSNYLELHPHDDVTLDDLKTITPAILQTQDHLLAGPIPNDALADIARSLTKLATVTFHPFPQAPAHSNNPDEWAAHAYTLLEYQQPDLARQAFLEARALDATHYDALFGLAVTEDQLSNSDAAEFTYQYVMNTHPHRFEARFNYALRTHHEQGPQAAIQHYQMALNLATNHPDETRAQAHAALARAQTLTQDHIGAAEHYQAAYRLTNDTTHLIERFKAQRAAGHALDLLPELTRHELDTHDARFTALIADIYAEAAQAPYAIDAINRRLRDQNLSDQQAALLLNARATTNASTGDHTEALNDLLAALELDPTNPTTHHNLGITLLTRGHPNQARPHLEAAIQLGVSDPLAHLHLAEAAQQGGDPQAAMHAASTAAKNLTGAPRQRALQLHAQAAHATWEYLASIPSLEELLQHTPNDPQLQLMAGTAYYQTGQYARAAQHLEAAHTLTSDYTINQALINAYLASQRYADAERAARTALTTTPTDPETLHKLGWALLHQSKYQDAKNAWTDAANKGHQQAQTDLDQIFK